MSIPVKHHYLPQFYLGCWTTAEENGCVIAYTRPFKDVVARAYTPAAIGYQEHLYAVPSRTDPAHRQEVETKFMSPIDDGAAKALEFIASNRRRPDAVALASSWSRFVMSLLYRSPERLQWMRRKLGEYDQQDLERLKDAYAKQRKGHDPPTYEEYREQHQNRFTDEAVAKLLRMMIDNTNIGTHLNNMLWTLIQVPPGTPGLLTSDSPVMMSNGIGIPNGFIVLPTGPSSLFIAANRAEVAQAFAAQPAKPLVRAMNDAVIKQADKLVIGATRGHKSFVDKRLGRGGPSSTQGLFQRMTWVAPI